MRPWRRVVEQPNSCLLLKGCFCAHVASEYGVPAACPACAEALMDLGLPPETIWGRQGALVSCHSKDAGFEHCPGPAPPEELAYRPDHPNQACSSCCAALPPPAWSHSHRPAQGPPSPTGPTREPRLLSVLTDGNPTSLHRWPLAKLSKPPLVSRQHLSPHSERLAGHTPGHLLPPWALFESGPRTLASALSDRKCLCWGRAQELLGDPTATG